MGKELTVNYGGYSTAGQKEQNQDAFAAYQPTLGITKYKGIAACIADGVSCSENSQLASTTSVTNFLTDYYSTPDSWDVKSACQKVLGAINAWLYHHGQQASARHNSLVTTFTGFILKSNTVHVVHVGDSQLLRIRNNALEPLTRPHTHRHGNGQELLSRGLGMDTFLDVDYTASDIQVDDILIATTDGVHEHLQNNEIRQLIKPLIEAKSRSQAHLEKVAEQLTDTALKNGSKDNLSCFILYIESVPEQNIEEAQRELTDRAIPPALSIGQKIDSYAVTNILYNGTRSHLYQVKDRHTDKYYVLKAPSLNFTEDLIYLEGFVREQWVGSRLDHDNVMKIYPAKPNSQFLYHLCEEIKGMSLRQWIHDNPEPSLQSVREIVQQVINGLRAFQRAGMLHRDLKPENVMITESGQVKLIDFGTVSVKGLSEIHSPIQEVGPVGSVQYIAPETVIDGTTIMQSDMFSLAVMIYEMLSGKIPYHMEKVRNRRAKSTSEWKYQSIRDHRPDLPLWLDLTLEKACHPNYRQRYEAYSELWTDLLKPNNALTTSHDRRPLLEQNNGKIWQLISALLAVIVVIQWYFLSR